MRTIKFRARRKNGKWVVGNFINHFSTYFKTEERHSIFLPKPENDNGGYWVEDIEPETVGQFTGLYDCDGKEIYEGDILRFGNSPSCVCEVKWNKSIAAFCIRFYFESEIGSMPLGEWVEYEKNVAIIGNIHDNPELLKGGEQ